MISPYNPYPSLQHSLVGRTFGAGLRTGGPLTHFVGLLHLRDGFSVHDDDPTFNPIDAPECMPSGCVAAAGTLGDFIDRDDYE